MAFNRSEMVRGRVLPWVGIGLFVLLQTAAGQPFVPIFGVGKGTEAVRAAAGRKWSVRSTLNAAVFDLTSAERFAAAKRAGRTMRIGVNLTPELLVPVTLEKAEIWRGGATLVWQGSVDTALPGAFHLAMTGEAVAGYVTTGEGRQFEFKGSPGDVVISEVDREAQVERCPLMLPAADKAGEERAAAGNEPRELVPGPSSVIDVLVVYTATAKTAAGGDAAMVNEIVSAISFTNQAYENSGMSMRIALAGTAEVSYTETGSCETALRAVTNTSDGQMDNVNTLRTQYGADLVSLWMYAGDCGGIGWVMLKNTTSSAPYGYSVTVTQSSQNWRNASFAHELGHNLGALHERGPNSPGPGLFSYSYGYQSKLASPRVRDIMAYECSGGSCERVQYFSSPNVVVNGRPIGVAAGEPDSADVALTLTLTAPTAEAYRKRAGGPNVNVSPTTVSATAAGGVYSVTLTGTGSWTSSSSVSWITGISPPSGTNGSQVSFSVAANTSGAVRQGSVQLGPVTVVVSQAADYTCTPAPIAVGETVNGTLGGGVCTSPIRGNTPAQRYQFTGSLGQQVTVTMNSGAFDTHVYLIGPLGTVVAEFASGAGTHTLGSAGQYVIEATAFAAGSAGAFTLGLTSTSCVVTMSPKVWNAESGAAQRNVTVTTGSGCGWSAASNAGWLTLTSAATGTGPGTIGLQVAANAGTTRRTGTLTIGETVLTVNQEGTGGCVAQELTLDTPVTGVLSAGGGCKSLFREASTNAARYTFAGTAGQQVRLLMESPDMDTYLYLMAPNGTLLAEDDEAAANANSAIPSTSGYVTLPVTGTYLIEAAGFEEGEVGQFWLVALPWGGGETARLVSGVDKAVTLPSVTSRTFFDWNSSTWAIVVPAGATRLDVQLTTQTPGANVDLYTHFGSIPAFSSLANYKSETAGSGTETISVTSSSSPALQAGVYYINLAMVTTNLAANATLRATVTTGSGTFVLTPGSATVGAGAGTGSFGVSVTPAGSAWTASSNAGWLTVTAPGNGTGNGTVGYSYPANTGAARSGSITVGSQLFTLNQGAGAASSVALGASSASVGAGAGSGSVTVTPTPAGTTWTAVANAAWLTVSVGNGAADYTYSANSGAARSGTLTIGGQTFTVNQAAGAASSVVLGASSASVGAGAGSGSVTVTPTPAGTTWTAVANAAWLTVSVGSGSAGYTYAANTGAARSGTLTIGGQTFTVNQAAGAASSVVLGASSASVGAGAGSGSVTVTPTPAGTTWTAVANAAWLTVSVGNGAADYTYSANSGAARSGTLTIGGQTVTVNQAAGAASSVVLGASSASVGAGAGSGSVTVTPTPAGTTWTAVANAAWLTVSVGSGSAGYTYAANTGAARSGTLTIGGQTFTVNQAAGAASSVVLGAASASVGAGAGSGSVTVTPTPAGATWTAVANAAWLTVSVGNGAADYTFAANSGAARSGTLTIGGQTFTVNQAAGAASSVVLGASSASVGAGAGSGSVTVTPTPAGTTWTAVANAAWLTVSVGNGAADYTYSANSGAARSGTLTIGGQTFTVNQAAGAASSVVLGASSASVGAGAGSGSVTVTPTPAGTTWTAVANAAWLTVSVGNGAADYTFAANAGAARSGTLTIGGQTFTVNQAAGAASSVVLGASSASVGAAAGSGSVTVTPTPAGTTWTAVANAAWLTVSVGSGSAGYTYAANSGAARSGTLTIGGQTFTVNQAAGAASSVALGASSASVGAAAGSGSVTVTPTPAGTTWTAVANAAWLTVSVGSGSAGYTYAANTGGARSGTLTIGGQTFTVNQAAGAASSVALGSAAVSVGSAAGSGSVTVTPTPAGTTWTAVANAGWLTVSVGNGVADYTYGANPGAARSGTLTIGGQTFTVNQAAAGAAAVVLSATSATVGAGTGAGSVTVTPTPAGTVWTAVANAGWLTVAGGDGVANYTYAANTGAARTGTLTIGGQTFTVNQAAGAASSVALGATSVSVGAAAGAGSVTVTPTPAGTVWTAISNAAWLTAGVGNGTADYTFGANAGAARTGTLTIGGQTFTVNQAAGAANSVALGAASVSVGAAAGAGSVTVTPTPAGTLWTAVANAAWLTVSVGNGTADYTWAANTGAARTGTLTIGGQTFLVNQAAAAASSVALGATSVSVGAAAGSGTVTVTPTPAGTVWTASSNTAWLTVSVGDGMAGYTWAANPGAARTGTLTIGGQTFTVNQAAAGAASVVLSSTSVSVSAAAGAGSVTVTPTPAGTAWTAVSNVAWLTVTAASGAANYTYASNTGAARSGTLTIGGQTFTVNQAAGAATSVALGAVSAAVGAAAGTGSVTVTPTPAGTTWTASANAAWLTVTVGNGVANYTYAANNGAARSGTLTIGGQTFTVNQSAPAASTVVLSANSVNAGAGAGSGSVTVTVTPAGSVWTAVANAPWLTVTAGNGVADYTYTANAGAARSGTLTIGGQTFTVNQAAGAAPVVTQTPFAGSGLSKVISVQFRSPAGAGNLGVLNVLINDALNGDRACYIAYSAPLKVLYLVNDGGPASGISAGLALGATGTVANGQCTIFSAGSSAVPVGTDTLQLNLNITFAAGFAGNRVVYGAARDVAELNSGWAVVGMHEVPGGAVTYPRSNAATPGAGNTATAAITFTYDDATTANNLQTVWALINTAVDGRQACYVAYYVPGNALYLIPDNGDGTQATSIALTGTNTIENSQCRISAAGSSVVKSGGRLTVTLNYTFKPAFAGYRGMWTAAQTVGPPPQTSAWKASGAWLVP